MVNRPDSIQPSLTQCLRAVRVRAARLLDLQLWCLGQDVRREGNLLLTYGFSKNRPPEKTSGSSEYAVRIAPDTTLTVWGYGMHLAQGDHQGGLFLRRFGFAPRHTQPGYVPQDCWHVKSWKRVRPPRTPKEELDTLQALSKLADAFAQYEQWVVEQMSLDYRGRNLAQWHRRPIVAADAIASSWAELAVHFSPDAAHAHQSTPSQRPLEPAFA